MKLVTFNIRCDFGQDGENNFEYRKDLILKKIAQEKPDMICFQEVLPHIALQEAIRITSMETASSSSATPITTT